MRNSIILVILSVFILAACAPSAATPSPAPLETALPSEAASPEPTDAPGSETGQTYTNADFGLSFVFPADWFGPEEYAVENTLRVEIGSDTVYPYGTGLDERMYTTTNSYSIVVQYTKNDQNDFWSETFLTLQGLADGESISDARGKIIRVAALNLGGFEGMAFISTLSDTAQTEPVYARQVILVDEQSNTLSIMGSPNNVEVKEGETWREVYEHIDAEFAGVFQQVLESLTIDG